MKTYEIQMLEATKIVIQSAVVLALCYALIFSHSALLIGVTGAAGFTISVCLHPHFFRSRSGSLIPAIGLVAFGWLCAAVVFVLSFFGAN